MEEDQVYEEFEEVVIEGNPQSAQPSQQPQQSQSSQPSQQVQQSAGTPQGQAGGNAQPEATGIETDDNMVEQAEAHGQPSNTISEWQRVHDKGYVERITEKTEKH